MRTKYSRCTLLTLKSLAGLNHTFPEANFFSQCKYPSQVKQTSWQAMIAQHCYLLLNMLHKQTTFITPVRGFSAGGMGQK